MGVETIFLLAYKFRIFNAYDEIHISVPIRRYRIVMRISHLLTFTSTELEFLKIISLEGWCAFSRAPRARASAQKIIMRGKRSSSTRPPE
jgi:hypothetical protein